MKRSLIVSSFLAAALMLSAGRAQAAPVSLTLTVDSANSNFLITVRALAGLLEATAATSLSGTQDITLNEADPIASLMSLDGGNLVIADTFIDLSGALGTGNAGLNGAALTGLDSSGQVQLIYNGGTWNYLFDPGDPNGGNVTSTGINTGTLTYQGTGGLLALLGSGTLDFSTSPVGLDLPSLGPIASLTQTLLGSTGVTTTYSIVMSAPLSASQTVITDPVPVDFTLQGQLIASGVYIVVPEPSTMVLFGVALAGLVPLYRRLRK